MQTYIKTLKVDEYNYDPKTDVLTAWFSHNGEPDSSELSAPDFRFFLFSEGSRHAELGSKSAEALDNYFKTCPTRQYAKVMIERFMMKKVEDAAMEEIEASYIEFEEC